MPVENIGFMVMMQKLWDSSSQDNIGEILDGVSRFSNERFIKAHLCALELILLETIPDLEAWVCFEPV